MSSSKNIKAILKEAEQWMTIPGVEGIGEGIEKGKTCITVFISCDASTLREKIPPTYMGYPVVLQESGIIQIQ